MEPEIAAIERLQTYALDRKDIHNSAVFSYGEYTIFQVHTALMLGVCNAAS
jgi:hypothetical protein